jgi:hypothetical protein
MSIPKLGKILDGFSSSKASRVEDIVMLQDDASREDAVKIRCSAKPWWGPSISTPLRLLDALCHLHYLGTVPSMIKQTVMKIGK